MGDAVTFYTIPRAFKELLYIRQSNAVLSWIHTGKPDRIVFIGNDEGVEDFAQKHGCGCYPNVQRNEWGTPLISDAFNFIQQQEGLAVFLNADIITPDDALVNAVRFVSDELPIFLVIGCRTDIVLNEPLDFSGDWHSRLSGTLHGQWGVDYLGFKPPLWKDIPPLAVGRMRWDNKLVSDAASYGAQLVDATEYVTVYHPEHGYEHTDLSMDNPEIRRNYELTGMAMLGVHHTHWVLSHDGLKRK